MATNLMIIGFVMVFVSLILLLIPHMSGLARDKAFKIRLAGLFSLVVVFVLFAIALVTICIQAQKFGIEGLFGLLSLYYAYDVGKQAISEKRNFGG